MTRFHHGLLLALVLLAVAPGCRKNTTPISPTGAIRIDNVTPSLLQAAPQPQTLTVTGVGFTAEGRASITSPDGTVQSSPIRLQTATQFSADVVLSTAGAFALTVDDGAGQTSGAIALVVTGQARQSPVVTSVTPGTVIRSDQSQTVTLSGVGLAQAQQIQVSRPDGQLVVLQPGQFTAFGDTSISFSLALDKVGLFSIVVSTQAGSSASVTVSVAAG